jgi:YegS/Rv2252/BmrU family lipid kinase
MSTGHSNDSRLFDRSLEKAALQKEINEGHPHAALVVNTRSRHGAVCYSEAKLQLTKLGVILDAAISVRNPAKLIEIVGETVQQGHNFIIVGGGDGTISSVVDHFAYTRVLFGVLPLGTANSFARTLGIPVNLEGAIDVLINGRVADVDLGKINEDYFANGSSIGLPAVVGKATPHNLKKWLGRLAYALVAAKEFMRYQSFRCVVTINDRETSFDALDVRIANGSYQGGILAAPEAKPDNGEIIVYILKGYSRWIIAKVWARLALGVPFRPGESEVLTASTLIIDALPKQDVAVDGEVITQTPVRVSVARNALLLLVPRAYEDL